MTPVVLFYLFRVYSKASPSRVQFSLPKKFCFNGVREAVSLGIRLLVFTQGREDELDLV